MSGLLVVGAIALDWDKFVCMMIAFSFLEGQVRILLGYNPIARILFDILLILGILRVFIKEKKFFSLESMPNLILRLILLHFLWWGIELFNPMAAGPLASFATAKYYIFPFFLFFALTLKPIDVKSDFFQQFLIVMLIIMILECAVCIYQMSQGEAFLHGISGYYANLFAKFKNFEGFFFRPWGTTFGPGNASPLLFLSLPLCFFIDFSRYKTKRTKAIIAFLFFVLFIISWLTLFISQVRSAFIKHILITATFAFIYFAVSQKKVVLIIRSVIASVILVLFLFLNRNAYDVLDRELGLSSSLQRVEVLANSEATDHRSGFATAFAYAASKTVWPMGYGPGMCTNYLPHYDKQRKRLLEYVPDDFWALDNLYVFVSLELGIGVFIYFSIIFTLTIYISIRALVLFRRRHFDTVRLIIPSITIFYILIIGNWGAVSLPFNPESFYFWLYAGIAINVAFGKQKKDEGIEETLNENERDNLPTIAV